MQPRTKLTGCGTCRIFPHHGIQEQSKAKSGAGAGDDDEEENGSGNYDGDDALGLLFLAPFSATVFGSDFFTGQSPGTRKTRRAKLQGLQWRRDFA